MRQNDGRKGNRSSTKSVHSAFLNGEKSEKQMRVKLDMRGKQIQLIHCLKIVFDVI